MRERLDYELGVIHKMGFDAYFLIVWDLCRYAREQGIWYNARGSAAGSIVAYTLEITLVDPLQHDLIFERFLNPGRISMPDIDLDFRTTAARKCWSIRVNKYGSDKVAQIITFGTLGAQGRPARRGPRDGHPAARSGPGRQARPVRPGQGRHACRTACWRPSLPEFKEVYESARRTCAS